MKCQKSKFYYVRCLEADGSDYEYQKCNTRDEAQAILDKQSPDDALYVV